MMVLLIIAFQQSHIISTLTIYLGNICDDNERVIDRTTAENFAKNHWMEYMEVSLRDSHYNIDELVHAILNHRRSPMTAGQHHALDSHVDVDMEEKARPDPQPSQSDGCALM